MRSHSFHQHLTYALLNAVEQGIQTQRGQHRCSQELPGPRVRVQLMGGHSKDEGNAHHHDAKVHQLVLHCNDPFHMVAHLQLSKALMTFYVTH